MQINRCPNCMEEIAAYPCPHCGCVGPDHSNPSAMAAMSILNGQYLVGRVLGQGGFGITYLGYDLEKDRKVAIKEYFPSGYVMRHPSMGNTLVWGTTAQAQEFHKNGTETFVKEAKKLNLVRNLTGVVKVYHVFSENDTAYIVMEYLQGESLMHRLKHRGIMNWAEAQSVFLPVIDTMAKCNAQGVIHRDISPDNLMLLPDGQVKVLDFGAAKDLTSNTGASSMAVGKNGFTPLEQYTKRGSSGPQADVYAMGATMYYTLTGVLPQSSLERSVQDAVEWDHPRFRELPANVQKAIRNAMALSPAQRTQTMSELLAQLTEPEVIPVSRTADLDVYREVTLDLRTDPGGKTVAVDTGSGKVSVNVPRNFHDGQTVCLTGQGSIDPVSEQRGNLYVTFRAPAVQKKASLSTTLMFSVIGAAAVTALLAIYILLPKPTPGPSPVSAPAKPTAPAVVRTTEPAGTKPSKIETVHTHSWIEADYNTPRTCAVCGDTEGAPRTPGSRLRFSSILQSVSVSSYADEDGSGDHEADKICDGNVKTNWTEGVAGSGIGEYAQFRLNGTYAVGSMTISIGSHYNDTVYRQNGRPSQVTLTFSDGSEETVSLKDTGSEQTIQLSRYYYTNSIRITIRDVYAGSKYQDTIIAEVSFEAYEP